MAIKKVKNIITKINGIIKNYDIYDDEAIHEDKLANNLTTLGEGYALDARQGRVLNDKIGTQLWQLFSGNVANSQESDVNILSGRSISDFQALCFSYKVGNYIRQSVVLPTSIFMSSNSAVELAYVDSTAAHRWIDFTYLSNERIHIKVSSNGAGTFYIYGFGNNAMY